MEYGANKQTGMPGHYMSEGSVADRGGNNEKMGVTGYNFGKKGKKKRSKSMAGNPSGSKMSNPGGGY